MVILKGFHLKKTNPNFISGHLIGSSLGSEWSHFLSSLAAMTLSPGFCQSAVMVLTFVPVGNIRVTAVNV